MAGWKCLIALLTEPSIVHCLFIKQSANPNAREKNFDHQHLGDFFVATFSWAGCVPWFIVVLDVIDRGLERQVVWFFAEAQIVLFDDADCLSLLKRSTCKRKQKFSLGLTIHFVYHSPPRSDPPTVREIAP